MILGLDVLAQRRRIRVAFRAAQELAREQLVAGVDTLVNAQCFAAQKRFGALRTAVRLVVGVAAHVDQHFVAGIETVRRTWTSAPLAIVEAVAGIGDDVRVRDVNGPLFGRDERSVRNGV